MAETEKKKVAAKKPAATAEEKEAKKAAKAAEKATKAAAKDTKKAEKEAKKANLDRQLAEGRIDGKEYNKQIIELVVPDERKKPITKTRRVTIILWIFSFLNIFFVISGLYTGSKSDSDGYLPEGMAIFIFAPLAIVFTICAIISSTKQK